MAASMVVPSDPGDDRLLDRISAHLEQGGLLAHPTETVYGLGAAADEEGVRALRALKGRSPAQPFLVLLPSGAGSGPTVTAGSGSPTGWGLEWTPEARALTRAFWPGPLTLVLSDPNGRFPPGVRSAAGGVAVRDSSHPFIGSLLARWGRPLLSTSANRPGDEPATTLDGVVRAVEGSPGRERLWIVDGGKLAPSDPSTLVDCTTLRPRVLRPGAIPLEALQRVIRDLDHD